MDTKNIPELNGMCGCVRKSLQNWFKWGGTISIESDGIDAIGRESSGSLYRFEKFTRNILVMQKQERTLENTVKMLKQDKFFMWLLSSVKDLATIEEIIKLCAKKILRGIKFAELPPATQNIVKEMHIGVRDHYKLVKGGGLRFLGISHKGYDAYETVKGARVKDKLLERARRRGAVEADFAEVIGGAAGEKIKKSRAAEAAAEEAVVKKENALIRAGRAACKWCKGILKKGAKIIFR